MTMCHMLSLDLDALHAMAGRLGIKRAWFQDKWGSAPHYDIGKTKRATAIKLGAIEADLNAGNPVFLICVSGVPPHVIATRFPQ